MRSVTLVKCAHEICHCLVEEGQQYCSKACANAKDMQDEVCSCDHPGCNTAKKFVEEKADPLKVD
jgi:hypothetical protein